MGSGYMTAHKKCQKQQNVSLQKKSCYFTGGTDYDVQQGFLNQDLMKI